MLVREWRPDTWEFGTLYEVQVDKMYTCEDFANFLHSNYFPHIPLDTLFATRINIQHDFIRSDLVLRSWHSLKMQKNWIGNSRLEINRDSVFIVVKDSSIRFKEPQFGEDDEILNKWASPQYLSHLVNKKDVKVDIKSDPLYDASLSHNYIGVQTVNTG